MDSEKWALVTGASSGIGMELSYILAQKGYNLILVARSIDRLNGIAADIENKHGVKTKPIQKDLSYADSAAKLFEQLKEIRINIFINNAGAGACGRFVDIDFQKDIEVINTNIVSVTVLTKIAAAHMLEKGGGKILNVASTGAYQPGPYTAVYYATKAYVLSLTQAIRKELYGTGVDVCALCPGATATEFSKRAGKSDVKAAMSASAVAKRGIKGLMKNKAVIIPGTANKIAIAFSKILPGKITSCAVAKIQSKLICDYKNRISGS